MLNSLELSVIHNQGKMNYPEQSKKKKNKLSMGLIKTEVKNLTPIIHRNYHSIDTSIQSSASDIFKFLATNERNNIIIPFDEYGTMINDTMARYQTEKNQEKNSDEEDELLSRREQTMIKNIYRTNSNNSNSKILQGTSEESMLKISVIDSDYKNPFQSFKVLKKNKRIYEDVTSKFLKRQEQMYDDSIQKFDNETMKFKVKMPKIKITNVRKPLFEMISNKKIEFDTLNPEDNDQQNYFHLNKQNLKNRKKLELKLPEIPVDQTPKLFAFYKYPTRNFPEGREQFSFYFDSRQLILWGGISSNKNVDVWQLNPDMLEWAKFKAQNLYPPNSRYGHSGVIYENKFYVFGGKSKTINYTFIPDLEVFDLEENLWNSPIINTNSHLKLRKNHIAEVIGHHMIIHGGVTENNEYLSDTHLLSFHPLKWVNCSINTDTPGPTLSGHSCALVLPSDIRTNHKFNIYKFPDVGIGRAPLSKIKEKGLYIFGGKSKEEGGLSNDLWVLKIGKKPLEWIKPETNGFPPSPRYFHSTNFFEEGNYLIVHGGRNDLSTDNFALNDTFVLDLNKFNWIQVTLYSDINSFHIFNRCGHSSIVFTNKLLVFGGMNNNNYIGSSLLIINLNFNYIPEKQTEDERALELFSKNLHLFGPEASKKLDRLKKRAFRRKLSIIDELVLPEIK